MEKSCTIAGPTPKGLGYNAETLKGRCLVELLTQEIEQHIRMGVMDYYINTGMGVNEWAALIVLKLKRQYSGVRLIVVRPCETQMNRWPLENQERYYNVILPGADITKLISKRYTTACMHECARYVVDHARHYVVVYDGRRRGSIAYSVGYAKKHNRNITIINSATLDSNVPSHLCIK